MDKKEALILFNTHTNKITNNKQLVDLIVSQSPANVDYKHLKQRLYHIAHNLSTTPTCNNPHCDKLVKWDKRNQVYTNTCGYKCSNKLTAINSTTKRNQTNQQRYGGNAPACSNIVKKKMRATNVERYGKDFTKVNATKSKERIREKYGVDNISQLDRIKQLKIETSKKKFGTTHPMQSQHIRSKVVKTNIEKYFRENPSQTHISIPSLMCLGNRSFLIDEHIDKQKTLSEIANTLGVNVVTVSRQMKKFNIDVRHHNNKISVAEQEIFDFVHTFCKDAHQSDRSILADRELDIVIPSQKIAIEYCGLYWHSTVHPRITRTYHRDKMNECNSMGYQLITIFENEWVHNKKLIKTKLKHILNASTAPMVYARHTTVRSLNKQTAKDFHTQHHIQGACKITSHNCGLLYNGEVVAVMSFTRRKDCVELVRYSTSCVVVGGFGKLFKHAKNKINTHCFISFADRRWSTGEIYEKMGWKLDKVLPPDYKYVEGNTLCHKFNYRHKNLHKKLTNYDPTLSEYQNTRNHSVCRIYDCGLLRYKYIC